MFKAKTMLTYYGICNIIHNIAVKYMFVVIYDNNSTKNRKHKWNYVCCEFVTLYIKL